jgi:hypothetical protein
VDFSFPNQNGSRWQEWTVLGHLKKYVGVLNIFSQRIVEMRGISGLEGYSSSPEQIASTPDVPTTAYLPNFKVRLQLCTTVCSLLFCCSLHSAFLKFALERLTDDRIFSIQRHSTYTCKVTWVHNLTRNEIARLL